MVFVCAFCLRTDWNARYNHEAAHFAKILLGISAIHSTIYEVNILFVFRAGRLFLWIFLESITEWKERSNTPGYGTWFRWERNWKIPRVFSSISCLVLIFVHVSIAQLSIYFGCFRKGWGNSRPPWLMATLYAVKVAHSDTTNSWYLSASDTEATSEGEWYLFCCWTLE